LSSKLCPTLAKLLVSAVDSDAGCCCPTPGGGPGGGPGYDEAPGGGGLVNPGYPLEGGGGGWLEFIAPEPDEPGVDGYEPGI
jgi:hypothetical protein